MYGMFAKEHAASTGGSVASTWAGWETNGSESTRATTAATDATAMEVESAPATGMTSASDTEASMHIEPVQSHAAVAPVVLTRSTQAGANAVRFVLEEFRKDGSTETNKYEGIILTTAVKVHGVMTGVVSTSCRIAARCKRHKKIHSRDVERAIAIELGICPAFAVSEDTVMVEGKLCSVRENDVVLEDFVKKQVPIMKRVPAAPTFRMHWLAVDGQQPLIPENDFSRLDAMQDVLGVSKKRIHSKASSSTDEEFATLSKEFQLYYDKTTSDLVRAEVGRDQMTQQKARAALTSCENDSGLDRLVPHFVRFASNHIVKNSLRLPALWTAINISRALVRNIHLTNIDLYLHELLPQLINCVVSKRLSESPSDNHWALRDAAADLVAEICVRYGVKSSFLRSDIIGVYCEVLISPNRPLTTLYGAVIGLAALGDDTVEDNLGRLMIQGDFLFRLLDFIERDADVTGSAEHATAAFEKRYESVVLLDAIRNAFSSRRDLAVKFWPLLDRLGHEWTLSNEVMDQVFV